MIGVEEHDYEHGANGLREESAFVLVRVHLIHNSRVSNRYSIWNTWYQYKTVLSRFQPLHDFDALNNDALARVLNLDTCRETTCTTVRMEHSIPAPRIDRGRLPHHAPHRGIRFIDESDHLALPPQRRWLQRADLGGLFSRLRNFHALISDGRRSIAPSSISTPRVSFSQGQIRRLCRRSEIQITRYGK